MIGILGNFNKDKFYAIFNEVCIQKTVLNKKETQKLSKYCIKCPYCRSVQKGILPFRENYELYRFGMESRSYFSQK